MSEKAHEVYTSPDNEVLDLFVYRLTRSLRSWSWLSSSILLKEEASMNQLVFL